MERVAVRPGISFTAIDLETANPRHSSPCAVGVVKVRDGKVVDQWSSLIKPHESCSEFSIWNTRAHGDSSELASSKRSIESRLGRHREPIE